MMINDPVIEIDVHGLKVEEAIKAVRKKVEQAGGGTYRVRIIHGYHGASVSVQQSGKNSAMVGS